MLWGALGHGYRSLAVLYEGRWVHRGSTQNLWMAMGGGGGGGG